MLIDAGSSRSWGQFQARERLGRLLEKAPHDSGRLGDVAVEIRQVQLHAGEGFQIATNAVYLLEARGTPTLVSSSEGAQARRYIEVVPDLTLARAEFVAGWLESSAGQLARESVADGAAIPRMRASTLAEIPVMLPPLEAQLRALDTGSRLRRIGDRGKRAADPPLARSG